MKERFNRTKKKESVKDLLIKNLRNLMKSITANHPQMIPIKIHFDSRK